MQFCSKLYTVGVAMLPSSLQLGSNTIFPSLPTFPPVSPESSLSQDLEYAIETNRSPCLSTKKQPTTAIITEAQLQHYFRPSTVPLFDAHCHVQLMPNLHTLADSLDLARRVGIELLAVCGTSPGDDWSSVRQIAIQFPDLILPQFGLHPWHIAPYLNPKNNNCASWEIELESLLVTFPTSGVGECGLDKSVKKDVPLLIQADILHKHFDLAKKYSRTITLHCIGAWGRIFDIVEKYCSAGCNINGGDSESNSLIRATEGLQIEKFSVDNIQLTGNIRSVILHCCNSMPPEFVPMFARLATPVYFSYTMRSKLSIKERAVFDRIPRNRLLIETDSPDQLPVGLKGEFDFNTPALLMYGLQQLCAEVNSTYEDLARTTYENSVRAFRFI